MGFFEELISQLRFRLPDRDVRVKLIKGRRASTVPVPTELHPRLLEALKKRGIKELYSHQLEALNQALGGKDFVIVTGTASGKTLAYSLPILDSILKSEEPSTALLLYPTKALGHDQLRVFLELVDGLGEEKIRLFTYDGDTPSYRRRLVRDSANILLTNPEMLHLSILPANPRWSRFLKRLRFVVVDELHFYRGAFGSHLGCVLRRLNRVVDYYGGVFSYILTSATISNPSEHAERLTGRRVNLIKRDGSPVGQKYFVIWNPPLSSRSELGRRSANIEATEILTELLRRGVQTIAFARSRIVAELLYLYTTRRLDGEQAGRIRAYRAGYLPEERRAIESALQQGKLLAVSTTSALELGIDIGSLQSAIVVGFPGTIASLRQQIGRAGRRSEESAAFFIPYSDPVDQYIARHPEFLFERSPESALADPQNLFVLTEHICCGAFELPLREGDQRYFGENFINIVQLLEEQGYLRRLKDKWYWSERVNPSLSISLRYISSDTFVIVDSQTGSVIGNVDSISAPELLYPGGVYIHEGETYLVQELDQDGKRAVVRKAPVDYYTQPIVSGTVELLEAEEEKDFHRGKALLGSALVRWKTVGYDIIRFYSLQVLRREKVELPEQSLETEALFLAPPEESFELEGWQEGLEGLRNSFFSALSMLAMCDKADIGSLCNTTNLRRPAICLYDRYPGGLGYARHGYEEAERLGEIAKEIISSCPCSDGCPACVAMCSPRHPVHIDPDLRMGDIIPDKQKTLELLERWLT